MNWPTEDALALFFGLFVLSSTFSIALSQFALGVALAIFLLVLFKTHYSPFAPSLRPFYIAIGAYVAWLLIACLGSPTPLHSLVFVREDWLFLIVPIGIYLLSHDRYRTKLLGVFAIAVAILSVYAILQHFTGWEIYRHRPLDPAGGFGWQARGTFGNRMTFGNCFGTAAMFLLGLGVAHQFSSRRVRLAYLVSGGLAFVATVFSFDRGVLAGLAVAIIVGGILLGRKKAALALGLMAVLIVLPALFMPGLADRFRESVDKDLSRSHPGGRLFIWEKSLQLVRHHPLFGVGLGHFEPEYSALLDESVPENRRFGHAHNDVINIAANSGLPASLLFITVWMVTLRLLWRGWRRRLTIFATTGGYFYASLLACTVFLITSLVEATFADEEPRQMLMFVWAAGFWPWYAALKGRDGDKTA